MPKYHVLLDNTLGQRLTNEAEATGLTLSSYVRLLLRGHKVITPTITLPRNNRGRFIKTKGTSTIHTTAT